ncbi:MAG: exodeoxyribonuclease V subunit gamma [Bacteroidaceae bacterium]|nr:exodeoxyribonuclease V subunit gamma [Bacteroidaceae bacterium]
MSDNSLNELNEAQRQAVLYCDGPSLVIAGAGSGKTRVLTYKIAYLISQGMAPWNILALTFTNKAADEMKSRIAGQVGYDQARRLWMGTFHSIFARILRTECRAIGFSPNFTIYDASDSKNLIKNIIKEMQLDDKVYKPSTVQSHISAAKNRLMLPSAYLSDPSCQRSDSASRIPLTGRIYERYMQRCRQADVLDFDDLLLFTYLLFSNQPEVLARYQQQFQYVLVDEYQDTNYAQHAIVWQLTQHHQRVCVVGDDAQSIYSFRGANIDNILTFSKLYSNVRLFKLEQNYRSTKNIVGAANSLIKHNTAQIDKNVYSEKEAGAPIHIFEAASDLVEAKSATKRIEQLHHLDHINWDEIAILYRTNAQSRQLEEELRKRGIPYRIYGGLAFYQRKEIKDLIAYFRMAVNPNDEEALRRVINYPARGIGATTVQRIVDASNEAGVSLWTVLLQPQAYNCAIGRAAQEKLKLFVDMIESFRSEVETTDAATLGERIANQSGVVKDIFSSNTPEDMSRQENLRELMSGLQQFVDDRREEEGDSRLTLSHYLQEVALITDIEDNQSNQVKEKVALMTVHAAKGLEFRVVFIVGMEENLFPNPMATSPREMEEERRLFYVAITRAKEQCYISYALNRYLYGHMTFNSASRFLREIDSRFVQRNRNEQEVSKPFATTPVASHTARPLFSQRSAAPTPSQRPAIHTPSQRLHVSTSLQSSPAPSVSQVSTSQGTLRVGSVIQHSRFGRGTVTSMTGSGIDAKATVAFDNVGTKQLLLRFAQFSIVG